MQDALKIVDLPDSHHNQIRDTTIVNYIREAKRRRIRHESTPSFVQKHYSIGDTVGIKIHKVDRTNTDSKILPCKVLDIKIINDLKSLYKILSKDGLLKNFYSEDDLVDLRTVCFPELNSVNPDSLNEISYIQACQKNINVCGDTPLLKSICNCAFKCNKLRCTCRKAILQCSTKWHTNNRKCEIKISLRIGNRTKKYFQ